MNHITGDFLHKDVLITLESPWPTNSRTLFFCLFELKFSVSLFSVSEVRESHVPGV